MASRKSSPATLSVNVEFLLAVKSKGKSAYKNANAVVKAVVEEANDEWETLQAKMREKSAKLKR